MEPPAHFGTDHVSDLVVHPSNTEVLAVAVVDGWVHLYSRFARQRSWQTPISNPRVCWADARLLVWGTNSQAWVLAPDGTSTPLDAAEHSDLAVAGSRLMIASRGAGLLSLQLSDGHPVLRERVRALGAYQERTLTASSLGAIAFLEAGRVNFQRRADAEWQVVEASCRAISFSRDGRKLAVVQARSDGSQVAVLQVAEDGSLDTQHHIPTFPVLAETVVAVDWSLDGNSVLVRAADGELEVRDVRTSQLTFSAHVRGMPRFYAADDLIVSGDPTGLHLLQWAPAGSNLWIRRRTGSLTPEQLDLLASEGFFRGDEVLLFVDDPALRPAAIYEVTNGRRTQDEVANAPSKVGAKLRLSLPVPSRDDLARKQNTIDALANATPVRHARALGAYDEVVALLMDLYPQESAAGSRIHQVLEMTNEPANEVAPPVSDTSGKSEDAPALPSENALGTQSALPTRSILSDRQAADIRASKAVGELHTQVARLVAARPSNNEMQFRNALTDAARSLSKRLIEVYSQLPDATQRTGRDELVKVIQDRVRAFILSSIATHARSSPGAARMGANLIASQQMGTPAEFDLAVYDATKGGRASPEERPRPEDAVPDRIGPWNVLGKLGDGGQATAYLVVRDDDPAKSKQVLKVLKPWSAQSKAASEFAQRARFSREVNALKELGKAGCPDLVQVLEDDLSPSTGQPWYAMPFYAGPLNKRFDEFKGNVERALVVAETMAATLAWMHEHEPLHVHRDVHAGNIFFDTGSDRAKLGDFGLVHVAEEREEAELISTVLEEFGPWQWRPPELHKGSPNRHDPMSDVYLLGGVIYGALTGGQFIEETEQGRTFAHETAALSIARFSNDPRVPHINALLRYMLARDPKARLSAARVAERCAQIRQWRPTEPSPMMLPSDEKIAAAAARLQARSEGSRQRMQMEELVATCARVQTRVPTTPGSPSPFQAHRSVSLDTNTYPRQLNDGSVLTLRALLRVRVWFGPEPMVELDSYVELASSADMRWSIAVQEFQASEFETVGSFLESDPEVENHLYSAVASQLDDLNHRLAAILEGA